MLVKQTNQTINIANILCFFFTSYTFEDPNSLHLPLLLIENIARLELKMDANKSSSSTLSVNMSETFNFKGKGSTLALLLLAMSALVISTIIYKCIRARRNDAEVDVHSGVELAATE